MCMRLLYPGVEVIFDRYVPALRFLSQKGFPHCRFFQEGVWGPPHL